MSRSLASGRPPSPSAVPTSSASASVKVADVLRKMPHVQVVSPVAIKIMIGSSVQNLYGIDYASYDALRPFVYLSGGPFQGPYDMLVDDIEPGASGSDPRRRLPQCEAT